MRLDREEKRQALNTMKSYVEGKISTIDFWNIYKNNDIMQYIIIHDKKRKKGVHIFDETTKTIIYDKTKPYDYNYYFRPESIIDVVDVSIFEHRIEVYNIIKNFFLRRKRRYHYYNEEDELYNMLQNILPEWLDMSNDSISSFILEVWKSMPVEMNEIEKIEACKNIILDSFKCETYPPSWLQNCEWPIYNGKPLAFIKQTDDIEEGCTLYFFINKENNEEKIIKQND